MALVPSSFLLLLVRHLLLVAWHLLLLFQVKDQKDQVSNLGTTSAGRMSKAAVEMRVRELAEASKAAESIYNVMPEEHVKVKIV